MADVKRILLIKYSQVTMPSGEKAVTCESFIQEPSDSKKKLFVKDCIDFELYNTGTISIFLWGAVEILPGQSFAPRKSTPLPFATDIPLLWADDYVLTRDVAVYVPPSAM